MRFSSWFASPCKQFPTDESLFQGLKRQEHRAIVCIQLKAHPMVAKIAKGYGLGGDEAEDILNQSTVILLRKIEDGSYQFQGFAPSTYLIEISKRVALMATRTQTRENTPLDQIRHLEDTDWELNQRRAEAGELVRNLLHHLGEPCRSVIRLHHIEGYSDEEVIDRNLTQYTTSDSLKAKRSTCMKKLVQLAQEWKANVEI
ncbi:MAG: hypothetical protein R2792_04905 [Saprospiraceae bacterium]